MLSAPRTPSSWEAPALSSRLSRGVPFSGTLRPAPLLRVDAFSQDPHLLVPIAFVTLNRNRLSAPLLPLLGCKFLEGGNMFPSLTYLKMLTEHELTGQNAGILGLYLGVRGLVRDNRSRQ